MVQVQLLFSIVLFCYLSELAAGIEDMLHNNVAYKNYVNIKTFTYRE